MKELLFKLTIALTLTFSSSYMIPQSSSQHPIHIKTSNTAAPIACQKTIQTLINNDSNLYKEQKLAAERDSLKQELEDGVRNYIRSQFPSSKLSAEKLVNECVNNDFDLILALAQGQIESGFGTVGSAKRTGSVWNVGAYENQTPRCRYRHPNESIRPYIKLVKKRYLGDRKKVKHLLNDYKDINGHKYASAGNYEAKLSSLYNYIKSSDLGKIYFKYKALL